MMENSQLQQNRVVEEGQKKSTTAAFLILLAIIGITVGSLFYFINQNNSLKSRLNETRGELKDALAVDKTKEQETKLEYNKYAMPFLNTIQEEPIKTVKLSMRDVSLYGTSSKYGYTDIPEDKKVISATLKIKYTGPVPSEKGVLIAAEDFKLVDENENKGTLTTNPEKDPVPMKLDLPRKEHNIYIYGGLEIVGAVNFVVDQDVHHFKLIYAPKDIEKEAEFEISTKMPIM